MSWRHGDLLWLLTLVPVVIGLLVLRWRLRARATARFGDPATVAALVAGRAAPWRAARAILWILAFAFFLLAMAGPQYGSRTRWLRQRGTDVVIALDFSKSMLAQDVRPSRIDRAKADKFVVRFKGGDPYVYGRGFEELAACVAAGVPVTVVPGITSAIAGPSAAGIPVTHRGMTHEVVVVSEGARSKIHVDAVDDNGEAITCSAAPTRRR